MKKMPRIPNLDYLKIDLLLHPAKYWLKNLCWAQGQLAYDLWHAVHHPSKELQGIKPFKVHLT